MADRSPQRPPRPDSPRSGEPRRRTDRAEKPGRDEAPRPARRERTDVARKAAEPGSGRAARSTGRGVPAFVLPLGALAVGLGLGVPIGLGLSSGGSSAAPAAPAAAVDDGLAAQLAEARSALEQTRKELDAALGSGGGEWGERNEIFVTVTRVLDGDTFEAEGYEKRFRYLGINAPEKFVDYYAKEAWERNKEFVLGKRIKVVFDGPHTDDLGRHLGYIYVGDTFVNLELVKNGYAPLYDDSRTKSIQQYQNLLAAVDAAKAARRGYWDDEARARWESSFQAEPYYNCTKGTVHRPGCADGETSKSQRIEDLETAMKKRKACRECVPTRNHPVYGAVEEEK